MTAPVLATAEELLAGTELTYDVEIPASLLEPEPRAAGAAPSRRTVRLRPLSVRDVQLIARAAKSDEVLTSTLMLQRALVEPALKEKEISAMRSGLVRFLVDQVNRISGLTSDADDLRELAQSPLMQAFFVLAKEFGWTPEQVRAMTIGQLLGYLEVLNRSRREG